MTRDVDAAYELILAELEAALDRAAEGPADAALASVAAHARQAADLADDLRKTLQNRLD